MVAIIDYKAGNLTSVRLAAEAVGASVRVTSDPADILSAERIVFPGVGAAAAAMENLGRLGLADAIRRAVAAGVPFIGICLGAQILFDRSDEDGGTPTLGILPGRVLRLAPPEPRAKIPHMGWNQAAFKKPHPVLDGIADGSDFYFVHSYYMAPEREGDILAETDFAGQTFVSAVARGNIVATQFHIEKSGKTGLRWLANFMKWDGREAAPC